MTLVYLLLVVLLLLLNAFFVLAEFAAVKMRPTRVAELVAQGNRAARVFQHVQTRLDEYLSVCQVGITVSSIGLGFVGEPAIARLVEPLVSWAGAATPAVSHTLAVTAAYALVSFLHILLGELVPKSIAIRAAERTALLTARPLRIFRWLFILPLTLLNGSANLLLRLLGFPRTAHEESHSRQELKLILGQSQATGVLSFRRLLFIENIFDLEGVKTRHAMRPAAEVKLLRLSAPWEENERIIRETRLSRYPLMAEGTALPVGVVHVKDLYYQRSVPPDLAGCARPYVTARPDDDIEHVLAELQRRRCHLAVVAGADGGFAGLITLEDVIEEIIGTIEDEFEVEPRWSVADALTESRILLELTAGSMAEAIRTIVARLPAGELPAAPERVVALLLERERVMSTYLGSGLALPHARIDGLAAPTLILARSESGVPVGEGERARLFFVLLTPSQAPRSQVRLLARIAAMMDSAFVRGKIEAVATPAEVMEAVKEGEGIVMR